jgi:Gas vesicle protein G
VGLFTGLLTLPLLPVRGVAWIAEVVAEEAALQQELLESPERALAELEAARAAGEIDDAEFAARENELLDAIFAARLEGTE